MIECPICSGLGDVFDGVAGVEITCPVCMGMGLIEAPAPVLEGGHVGSLELTLANGARLVVDDGPEALRLVYDGGVDAFGVKRNCDLNPDDALTLMVMLASSVRRRFGPEQAWRIAQAVARALSGSE